MKGKAGWLILSCLVAVSLALISCGPAATSPTPSPTPTPTPTLSPTPTPTATVPSVEKPQYGGTLTLALDTDLIGFDPAYTVTWQCYQMNFTHDKMLYGDWKKGPGGTGETGFLLYTFMPHFSTGYLAESWELPDAETIIFRLRQGIKWQNRPPVNGREVVADDVVFSFKRLFEIPESYLVTTHKALGFPTSIKALDKYTVEIKVPPASQPGIFRDLGSQTWTIAPEIVKTYGDHKNWRYAVGNGPFILKDFVPDSMAVFVKNPDYWMENPLHPGDKLPYVDTYKRLVIKDVSTRLSALRTGKIDALLGVEWEDKDSLIKTNPELKWARTGSYEEGIAMRVDTKPFDDVRVRRALWLAMDNLAIRDVYYGGNAALLNYPVKDLPDFKAIYTPLEQLPQSVQELYGYNPDKAKQLLTEAGYPNGFKAEIITRSEPRYVELLEVIKEQWSKIGVQLDIKPMEFASWNSIAVRFQHKQMIYADSLWTSSPFKCQTWGTGQGRNLSIVSDPWLDEKFKVITGAELDWAKGVPAWKEVIPYLLDKAFYVQPPNSFSHSFWQPWFKDYHGEYCIGYTSFYMWVRFGWLDLDLKAKMMGGK